MKYVLKNEKNIALGVGTSATQIEGGKLDTDWNEWYQKGHIADGSDPARAADHYARWKEDAAIMAQMGIRHYRMSIDWARVQPTPDCFDEAALAHYREEILALSEKGISVLLTLHHFTNPMWFVKKGGFLSQDAPHFFCKYVQKVVETLGDLVAEYVTVNEPNVYMCNGFLFGIWPAGKRSILAARKVYTNLIRCHIAAYKLIHLLRPASDTRVGIADHLRAFAPFNARNRWQTFLAKTAQRWAQEDLTEGMLRGKCRRFVKKHPDICEGKYYDFIGINYYTRNTLYNFSVGFRKNAPQNDLGWEIYPDGIRILCEQMKQYGAPIYVTENGICDNDDSKRVQFIFDHLRVLFAADAPVERYYHWSLMDNFEWADGESARFGLVHIDYETQRRTLKKSGAFYKEIIENQGVTEQMVKDFDIFL